MFQLFCLDFAKVDLGCCICCNDNIRMLQAYVSSVLGVFKCFIWMLHMLLWLYTHVSGLCFKCFSCFKLMLQVFHLDVVKVYLDVAYVVMATHACFKCFHMF